MAATASPDTKQSPPFRRTPTGAGAEPGIDPRDHDAAEHYAHFKEECVIDIIDYSSEHVEFRRLGNEEAIQVMRAPVPNDGGKQRVRWINIGGIDWGVLSAVALRYNLHSLALEDVLHEQGHNLTKADYYPAHLFLRVLCHTLEPEGAEHDENVSEFPLSPTNSHSGDLSQAEKADAGRTKHSEEARTRKGMPHRHVEGQIEVSLGRRFTGLSGFRKAARQERIMHIHALTKGDRVNVKHEPMFIFLTPDGTVISLRPTPSLDFTAPISERLRQNNSVLRESEDASLLLEGILDLVVDKILEVMDEYQDKIHNLEHNILLRSSMSTVRSLHILSGDLIMNKRTLEPIRTMIYGLRRYDEDRCAALSTNRVFFGDDTGGGAGGPTGDSKDDNGKGYLSYKTKVYLADVQDHMDFVLTSLDMFAGISENLINYGFNVCCWRRLTLATIIFLPLTLLTGYFGMNFKPFPAADNHSDLLFWEIALPVMAVLVPIFMWSDIVKLVHYLNKRMTIREIGKVPESNHCAASIRG
ncbi:hypothetical protein BD779DRAFT_1488650 [Infundibulicybe gibba]|nr:hypothetical protein BD779DRAFT_1488650 [Infundibulicybe gibba]